MDASRLYVYQATVTSVYDGDTVRVDIDLGLNIIVANESIRLHRINAKEVRGNDRPDGLLARDYLRSRIEGKRVLVQTIKDKKGKYGRYIAEIWLSENDRWTNINDEMVTHGFALYHDY